MDIQIGTVVEFFLNEGKLTLLVVDFYEEKDDFTYIINGVDKLLNHYRLRYDGFSETISEVAAFSLEEAVKHIVEQ